MIFSFFNFKIDMMKKCNIYDSHTLFVLHKGKNENQIKCYFYKLLPQNITTNFIVQMVYDKIGNYIGHCFVYVTNSEAFEYLIKLKEKVKEIKIIELPPGIVIKKESSLIGHHSWYELENSCEITSSEEDITLYYDRAFISPIDTTIYHHNALRSKNVPHWVTKNMLEKIFKQFSNSPNYPLVNISNFPNGRIAFVTFDPNTNDANFALHMTKKLKLNNDENEVYLMWSYTYKNNSTVDKKEINSQCKNYFEYLD